MTEPLWQKYRDQFPVTQNLIYLNHAAVAPLSTAAAAAIHSITADVLAYGSLHYDQWLAAYEGLRVSAAKLIGAHRDEIALVKNTSEGIATVAMGFDWRPNDRIILFEDEFPANVLPWKQAAAGQGASVVSLRPDTAPDEIERHVKGARLLAISFVQYLSGYRADLRVIGEICRRHECFFFVDAIQGLGAFPLDVNDCLIDGLAADGHKWLLGPEGCGLLYIRRERLDLIRPVEWGWSNIARYASYPTDDFDLRHDAGRFECGTLNTVGCFGLRAAIELLLAIGIDRISAEVLARADQLASGLLTKGYETLDGRDLGHAAGIVSFRKPGVDGRFIVRLLKDNSVLAAPRKGWVRASPHFYLSPDDIGRVLDLLP